MRPVMSLGQFSGLPYSCTPGELTYGFNDIVDQLLGLVDLLLGIRHDQAMEIFLLVASVSGIRSTFSFLDGAFASDGNLCSRLFFHCFESVSTRSDEQADLNAAKGG